MPTYETLFITPPNLVAEDESATIETMSQVVTDGGGSITVAERMGRRRLAYPIKEYDEGIYIRLLYDSGADVPRELERRIRLSENVLRGLTVRLGEDWAAHAKEQAVRDAQRRAEAEAAAAAAAAAEQAAAEAQKPDEQAAEADGTDSEVVEGKASETAEAPPEEAGEPPSEVEDGDDADELKS